MTSRPIISFVLALGIAGFQAPMSLRADDASGADVSTEEPANVARDLAERLLKDFQEAGGIPGLSFEILESGSPAFALDLGLADIEQRVAVTPRTRFRLGSLSKSLTAALLMRLVEQGKIALDRSIVDILPSLPEQYRPITPRLLAGHLAGIRHYEADESTNALPIRGTKDSLARFLEDPLVSTPGSTYRYSSYGYVLLGAVLEAACGRDFEACLAEEVLQPFGLSSVVADYPDHIVPDRTRFYEWSRDGLVNAPFSDRIYKLAAGGYLSTVADLARFGSRLLSGGPLGGASVETLFTTQRTSSGEATGYGMGFRPDEDWWNRHVVHHGGSSEGGRAFLMIYPQESLVLAFAANVSQASFFQQEAWTLASLFLDGPGSEPSPELASAIEGIYDIRAGGLGDTGGGEEEVTGTLYLLTRTSPDYGYLVLDGARSTRIRLSLLRQRRGKIWIVGSGRSGMLNLWLQVDGSSLRGEWNWLGKMLPVVAERHSAD